MAAYPLSDTLSFMTYGPDEPPSGWRPPSDPEPRLYGRRRAPEEDEDEPADRYGDQRAFRAPPPPPVAEPPRRPADPEPGQYVPRRAILDNGSATYHVQAPPPQPIEPDARHPDNRHPDNRPPDNRFPEQDRRDWPAQRDPRPDPSAWPPHPAPPPRDVPPRDLPPQRDSRDAAPPRQSWSDAPPREPWTDGPPRVGGPSPRPRGAPPVPAQWGAQPEPGFSGPGYDDPDRSRPIGRGAPDGTTYGRGAPDSAIYGRTAPGYDAPGYDVPDREALGRPERPGRSRPPTWMTALGITAVAVLVAVLVVGGYVIFTGTGSGTGAAGGPKPRDISTQQVDPPPLTEAELFPAATVTVSVGSTSRAYQVQKPQLVPDCKGVAVGDLAATLVAPNCTQVVRATLLTADKTYVLTAGLVNLPAKTNADQLNTAIQTSVGAQKGRFTGYNAGPPSDVFTRAATQLGWDVRGHYVAYCVVARADGKPIDTADQTAHQVIDDLVEKYLLGTVIQARVTPPPSSPATTKPSAR
jgi:hypothetical protein